MGCRNENLSLANSEDEKSKRGVIPAGTLCHCQGIPFVILADTVVYTHPGNIGLMEKLEVEALVGDYIGGIQ